MHPHNFFISLQMKSIFLFFEINITTIFSWIFNLIQDGLFRSCSKLGSKKVLFSKICHTYPTIMKLGTAVRYLKRIHKIYKSRETSHDLCWYQFFFTGNQQLLLYQEIQIIALTLFKSLKVVLINKVAILIMSAKLAILGPLRIKVFWNKVYDVLSFFHDVTNKILLRDSNYIVIGVMWPKFCNSSISMRQVIITSFL